LPELKTQPSHGFFFSFITFFGRFGGVLRALVIAAFFGANLQTDGYRLAFQAPEWLFFLISGTALGSAFTPIYSELIANNKEKEASDLFNVLLSVILTFGVAALIFGAGALNQITHLLAPGKPQFALSQISEMAGLLMPAMWCLGIGSLLYGALYARRKLAIPGLGNAILSFGVIFGALSGSATGQIEYAAWGALAGAIFGSLVFPLIAVRGSGIRYKFSLDFKTEGVALVLSNLVRDSLIFGMPVLLIITMQVFASDLQPGSNSILDYATQVAWLPVLIFGIPLSAALSPALAHFRSLHRPDLERAEIAKSFTTMCFLVFPISAALLALAPAISVALFEHGKFEHQQALQCAYLLRVFAVGVAGWAIHPIFARALIATTDAWNAAFLGLLSPVLLCITILAMSSRHTPLAIIPLGFTVVIILVAAALFFMVCQEFGWEIAKPCAIGKLKCLLCAGVAGGVLYGASILLEGPLQGSFLWPILLLLLLAGAWINLLMGKLLKMPEAGFVERAM
jgi:putative peptidoglycan lipid II flippase